MKTITENRKGSHAHGLVRLIPILFKATYKFNAIPIKFLTEFLHKLKNNFKIHMLTWKTQDSPNNKNIAVGINTSGFKLYYRAIVVKIA